MDTLCPPFEVTGPVATCNPVAGSALHVVSQIVPVQEGEGNPSPENVRPISGWEDANVNIFGQNLYSGQSDIAFTQRLVVDLSVPIPPGKYCISAEVSSTDTDDNICLVSAYYKDNTYTSIQMQRMVRDYKPITLEKTVDRIVFYASRNTSTGEGDTATFSNIMISSGTEELDYVPYNEESKTITIPFGQTVYGGTLDWNTGVLTVDTEYLELKSSMNFNIYNYIGTKGIYVINVISQNSQRASGICSHEIVTENSNPSGMWLGVNSRVLYWVKILDILGYTTVDEFKTWLDTQNVQIVCKLNTPITVQLTPAEILALSGVNTLYTDTGDTTVSGLADPIQVIQKLTERIAALEQNAIGG